MKSSLLCWCIIYVVVSTVCFSGAASSIAVQININTDNLTEQGLPNDINVTFTTSANSSTEFRMFRVDYDNLPIYSIETDQDGQRIIKENVSSNENVAFYQDTKKGAVFQLFRGTGEEGLLDDIIITRGQYRQGNFTYFIEPTVRPKRDASQNDSPSEHRYEIKQVLSTPSSMDFLNPPPEYHSSITTNMEIRSTLGSKFKRRKRQAFTTYYIDVTAFLDSTCYSRFLGEALYDSGEALRKIREYYAFIFTGIDLIYRNFQSTKFQLRVRVTKIVIFKTTYDFSLTYMNLTRCAWFGTNCKYITVVNTLAVVNSFTQFLNSTRGKDLVFPYDHAMLFIGDDMWASTTDILGLAWLKTICRTDGMSASVIEDTGDYSAIFTGAHELGHSLSADHDGTSNLCSTNDRYLMAPSDSDPTDIAKFNPWRFSTCTVRYFESYLTTLANTASGLACLSNTLAVLDNFPDVSHRLLGQEIPAEKQCQLRFGSSSFVCKDLGLTNICPGMYCYNPSDNGKCYSQSPLSGTTCGCGKVCNQGLCDTDALAPVCGLKDINSNCSTNDCYSPSLKNLCQRTCEGIIIPTTSTTTRTTKAPGCYDDPTFTYLGGDCRTLDKIFCIYSFINDSCCSTCKQSTTTTPAPGCYDNETFTYYGDTCRTLDKSYCIYSFINKSCCSTCTQSTTTTPGIGCYDDSTFTYFGQTCRTISPYLCSYSYVNQSCCRTCSQRTTTVPNYGCYDDSTFTYYGQTCQDISPSLCIFSSVNQSCCRTCTRGTTTAQNYVCNDDVTFRYDGLSCQWMSQSYCAVPSVSQACCSFCRQTITAQNYWCYDDVTFRYAGVSCQWLTPSYCTIPSVSKSCCSLCWPSTASPTTTATCQDDPYFFMDGKNCYSAMVSSTNYCYNPAVNRSCCASCAKRSKTIKGCEFGDRDRTFCSSISSCLGNTYDCCYTCGSRGLLPRGINLLVFILAILVSINRNVSK